MVAARQKEKEVKRSRPQHTCEHSLQPGVGHCPRGDGSDTRGSMIVWWVQVFLAEPLSPLPPPPPRPVPYGSGGLWPGWVGSGWASSRMWTPQGEVVGCVVSGQ